MTPPDSVLWARAAAGDADAFGLLFERHAQAIYAFCAHRVGDRATAEDLLSIVFLEAWRRRRQPLPPDKVLPWLYGVATNVVRNRRRSERRYAAALRRLPAPRAEEGFAEEADSRLDDEREMQDAFALLARLPRREQEVLALCTIAELSYEDAAVALGLPIGTVRSRLSRGRARLRELHAASGHEWDDAPDRQEALDRLPTAPFPRSRPTGSPAGRHTCSRRSRARRRHGGSGSPCRAHSPRRRRLPRSPCSLALWQRPPGRARPRARSGLRRARPPCRPRDSGRHTWHETRQRDRRPAHRAGATGAAAQRALVRRQSAAVALGRLHGGRAADRRARVTSGGQGELDGRHRAEGRRSCRAGPRRLRHGLPAGARGRHGKAERRRRRGRPPRRVAPVPRRLARQLSAGSGRRRDVVPAARPALDRPTGRALRPELHLRAAATYRILTLRALRAGRGDFTAPKPVHPSPFDTSEDARRYVGARTAAVALRPQALWAGRTVAGLRYAAASLSELSLHGRPSRRGPSTGIVVARARQLGLFYGDVREPLAYGWEPGRRALLIVESPDYRMSAFGFGFNTALGRPLALGGSPVPSGGRIVLNTQGPRHWVGQLRRDGLYVEITGSTRAAVLAAARALKPMPR